MQNKIPVLKSYQNKSSDELFVVCETSEARDELKNLVQATHKDIIMNTPKEKRVSVTIVGFEEKYEKDEIIQMLELQNGLIRVFSRSNDIKQHIEIHAICPLKNNPERFQAFASVSPSLRCGFKACGDKTRIGLSTCKIYDRFHVKRCFNCQDFKHYSKDCPNADVHVCAKCGSNHHSTKDCDSGEKTCINCIRHGKEEEANTHSADSFECPILQKEQELVRSKLVNSLNMVGNMLRVPP